MNTLTVITLLAKVVSAICDPTTLTVTLESTPTPSFEFYVGPDAIASTNSYIHPEVLSS